MCFLLGHKWQYTDGGLMRACTRCELTEWAFWNDALKRFVWHGR